MAASGDNNFSWDGFSQVQELTEKNQELTMALDAKDREIANLTALMETGGNVFAADVRESKIVEMAKKNRALTLQLEREKAEKQKLRTELKAAHAGNPAADTNVPKTQSQIEAACREIVAEAAETAETAQKEAADWKEKAKEAASRAERDAARASTTKAENERLKIALKKEVGDALDFDKRLDEQLKDGGGWRGRAQEISLLKEKVKSLKLQLAEGSAASGAAGAAAALTNAPLTSTGKHDAAHKRNIEALEKKRRQTDAEAEAEREAVRAELEASKRKAEAAAARRATVEKELRTMREKMKLLTDKSANDDKLIDAMRKELRNKATGAKGTAGGGAGGAGAGLPAGGANFSGAGVPQAVYTAMERRCQSQEQQIKQQEAVVQQLHQQLQRAMASASMGGGASPSDIAAAAAGGGGASDEDMDALIAHSEGLEKVIELLKGQLAKAEANCDELQDRLSVEHQRFVQLEARISGAAAGDGGFVGATPEEEVQVLRAALTAQKEEVERVQKSAKIQIEGMEEEVGLYRAMVEELRAARG